MKIEDFTDLLDTMRGEYVKMSEDLGVKLAPESLILFTSKTLLKYLKLYDVPLYEQEKRKVKLDIAIKTMPHGFIWKFFHRKLYRIMKKMGIFDKKKEDPKEDKQQSNESSMAMTKIPSAIERVSLPLGTESSQGLGEG